MSTNQSTVVTQNTNDNNSQQLQLSIHKNDISQNKEEKNDNILTVGIRFRIDQLSSVNTQNQTYETNGFLYVDWKADKEDIENYTNIQNKKQFVPKLDFEITFRNALSVELLEETKYQLKNGRDQYKNNKYILEVIHFKAVWSDEFYLSHFPFDVQNLVFIYCSRHLPITKVQFVPSQVKVDTFMLDVTSSAIRSFDISPTVLVEYSDSDWKYAKSQVKDTIGSSTYSTVYFRVQIARKSSNSASRVMIWMFFLAILCLLEFSIHPSQVSERLSYSIGLVFALIAFQFIIDAELPKIPYLTIVDKYIFMIFALILVVTIESVVVGFHLFHNDEEIDDDLLVKIDYIFYGILCAAFVIFHIGFLIYINKISNWEKRKIGKTIDETLDMLGVKDKQLHFLTVLSGDLDNRK